MVGYPGPQIEINILTVHPELRVEHAMDGIGASTPHKVSKCTSPVSGCGSAGAEHFLLAVVLSSVRLPNATAVGHSIQTIVVSRRMKCVGPIIKHQLRSGHTCPWVTLQCAH